MTACRARRTSPARPADRPVLRTRRPGQRRRDADRRGRSAPEPHPPGRDRCPYDDAPDALPAYRRRIASLGLQATVAGRFTRALPRALCSLPATRAVACPSLGEALANVPFEVALWARDGLVEQIDITPPGCRRSRTPSRRPWIWTRKPRHACGRPPTPVRAPSATSPCAFPAPPPSSGPSAGRCRAHRGRP